MPVTVWLILDGDISVAFWIFAAACVSDAVDGFVAKRFNCETALGAYLDPIADKALLVSVFVTLGAAGLIDAWLVILVVFRDAVIVCGAYVFHLLYQRLVMQPLAVSKVNTAVQFVFPAVVMGAEGFGIEAGLVTASLSYLVALTTLASGAAYVAVWSRRAAAMEPGK